MGRCVSGNFPDYKSAFIRSPDSILDSQIDRGPDPESAEKLANHQEFPVFTLRIHSLNHGECIQELILIRSSADMILKQYPG